ncbi:hypothetical protein NBRGN_027_00590 [Nocardia brasiliensis NBRC 14402]|nr:hypothetical protein NBRGN_027_00590 [Nocardia brasiliensis NBRC 14402]
MRIPHVQQHAEPDTDACDQQRNSDAAPTGPGRVRGSLMRRRFRCDVRAFHSTNRNRGASAAATTATRQGQNGSRAGSFR